MANISSAGSGVWSAGATWVGGVVPVEGNGVTIAAGHTVTIDQDITCGADTTTAADGLLIQGILQVLYNVAGSYYLRVKGHMTMSVAGQFLVGTAANPLDSNRTFTLRLNYSAAYAAGKYDWTNAAAATGKVSLYGQPKSTYSMLTAATEASDTVLEVTNHTGWVVGDYIVIGNMADNAYIEKKQIVSFPSDTQVEVSALSYDHEINNYIMMITSNVVIRAENATYPCDVNPVRSTMATSIFSYVTIRNSRGITTSYLTDCIVFGEDSYGFSSNGYKELVAYTDALAGTIIGLSTVQSDCAILLAMRMNSDLTPGAITGELNQSVFFPCPVVSYGGLYAFFFNGYVALDVGFYRMEAYAAYNDNIKIYQASYGNGGTLRIKSLYTKGSSIGYGMSVGETGNKEHVDVEVGDIFADNNYAGDVRVTCASRVYVHNNAILDSATPYSVGDGSHLQIAEYDGVEGAGMVIKGTGVRMYADLVNYRTSAPSVAIDANNAAFDWEEIFELHGRFPSVFVEAGQSVVVNLYSYITALPTLGTGYVKMCIAYNSPALGLYIDEFDITPTAAEEWQSFSCDFSPGAVVVEKDGYISFALVVQRGDANWTLRIDDLEVVVS